MQTLRGMLSIFARGVIGDPVLRAQVSMAALERAREAASRPLGTFAAMERGPDVGAGSGNCAWSRGPSYQSWWFQRRLR